MMITIFRSKALLLCIALANLIWMVKILLSSLVFQAQARLHFPQILSDFLLVMTNMAGMITEYLNFEGGCYAKVINLTKNPSRIFYNAIKRNARYLKM